MKNKYNKLRTFISENTKYEYRKETINGLFRSVLQPFFDNLKLEGCILFKLDNIDNLDNFIKRLSFSNAKIYSYNDALAQNGFNSSSIDDKWDSTEFIVIIAQRYSAALIWDYEYLNKQDCSEMCIMFNSKSIVDVVKEISSNSTVDLKEYLQKYPPDRRGNSTLNVALNELISELNNKNEEIKFSEKEKERMIVPDDALKTADIVAKQAKFIAHEIKNNLSIINLYSKISEKRMLSVKADEDVLLSINNSLKNINNASEAISSLINELRSVSVPSVSEISLKNLILNTMMLCEEKANNFGVKINISDFNDCVIETDKIKLQSVLMNIIYNAIEACKSGCSIFIDSQIDNDIIKIFVKNNGPKIPKNIQEKIFEVEFTTKEKGNGLGLSICKMQMKLISGDVNLVYSNDKETLFEITIIK